MRLINIQNGTFSYPNQSEHQIDIEQLEINRGEAVVLCGNSGGGKSTLTHLLNGISPEYIEGKITGTFQVDQLIAGMNGLNDYVGIVGSVFQNPRTQHFTLNTTDEIVFPCENMGLAKEEIESRARWVIQLCGIEHLLDRHIFDLSGGEKQLIALASTLMLKPTVLILDEVTSNLDQETIGRVQAILKELKKEGITLLIVDHRLEWTVGLVDRYLQISDAKIINQFDKEMFTALTPKELRDLGLRSNRSVYLNQSEDIKQASRNPILKTEHLTIGHHKPVLQQVEENFKYHEVTAIVGAIGTGKTTLGHTLGGLLKPIEGQVIWDGQKQSSKDLLKKAFIVMQDVNYQLFHDTVWNEVSFNSDSPEHVERLLNQLNLSELKERHPQTLSGGEKQRVLIAAALASNKRLLIFDEPTSGFDFENMERFGSLLEELKKEDIIIIVITHDLELASEWCDRVIDLTMYK